MSAMTEALFTRRFIPVFLDVPEAARVLEKYADELRNVGSPDARFVSAVAAGVLPGLLVPASPQETKIIQVVDKALLNACRRVANCAEDEPVSDGARRECQAAIEPYPEDEGDPDATDLSPGPAPGG